MNCKVLLTVDFKYMYFQYLFDTVSLLSGNNNKNNLAIGDWVNNLERLQNNEGGA